MSLTYNELKGQYAALQKTAELILSNNKAEEFIKKAAPRVIVFIGCGSSYCLAKSLATTTQMHLKKPAMAIAGGDLMIHAKRYSGYLDSSLIVAVSRSGSTSEVIMAIEQLKSYGCKFVLFSLCCVNNSKLSKMSDLVYEMPWAFDSSVCQTRNITNLYFEGILLIAKLAGDEAAVCDLLKTASGGSAYLEKYEDAIKNLAGKPWTHAVVMGDAEISGLAETGALSFKEICQLNSNYYNILDARHGPMVMLKPDTLVIIAMSDPSCKYERDFIEDVKKKRCQIIVYSDTKVEIEGVTVISFGEKLDHMATGVPFIMIPQLIAYYKSEITGTNPDKPDGLSPWILL